VLLAAYFYPFVEAAKARQEVVIVHSGNPEGRPF
jgi:hypothetical protein